MLSPFPSSVIGILKAALRTVENSGLLAENSAGVQKMREGFAEVIAELELLAALENHSIHVLVSKIGPDIYQG